MMVGLPRLPLFTPSSPALASEGARRLIALVDYVGSDYQNTVQSVAVLSGKDYREMRELSHRALVVLGQLDGAGRVGLKGAEKDLYRPLAFLPQTSPLGNYPSIETPVVQCLIVRGLLASTLLSEGADRASYERGSW